MGDEIDKLVKKLKRARNIYRNKVELKQLTEKARTILKQNIEYRNKYKGRKCFIMGNGPSVNKIDFSLLSDELVITVNEMFRHENFAKLKSDFHFIADPAYLKLDKKNAIEKEIIDKLQVLADSGTTLWLPLGGMKYARLYGWKNKVKIQYYSSKLDFYDDYEEDVEFTQFIPKFQAVVQWAIVFAVYMGCSEIYLLGCDATNIITDLSLFVKDVELTYAYDLSEDAAEFVKKKHKGNGLEYTLFGYWRIVHIFSELQKYCRKRNVKLYNCSEESILDFIPKKKIEDCL